MRAALLLASFALAGSQALADPGVPVTLGIEFDDPRAPTGREAGTATFVVAVCANPATAALVSGPTRIALRIVEGAGTVSPQSMDVDPRSQDEDGCARSNHATVRVIAGWTATVLADAAWNFPLANATATGETPPVRPAETRGDPWTERRALAAGGAPGAAAGTESSLDRAGENGRALLVVALLVAGAAAAIGWRVVRRTL